MRYLLIYHLGGNGAGWDAFVLNSQQAHLERWFTNQIILMMAFHS